MKSLTVFILAAFLCISAKSQIPVTDVGMNTQTTVNQFLNISTWTNQLNTHLSQLTALQTTLKYVQKVSSTVKTMNYTKDLIKRQATIVKNCQKIVKSMDKLDPTVALALSSQVEDILYTNNSIISLCTNTISESFKMNDSERMEILMRIKEEQTKLLSKIGTLKTIMRTNYDTKDIIKMKLFK